MLTWFDAVTLLSLKILNNHEEGFKLSLWEKEKILFSYTLYFSHNLFYHSFWLPALYSPCFVYIISSTFVVCCRMVFNAVTTVFQVFLGSQCTYPCFSGVLLSSTLHNILSKPLAAFPHNHCPSNGQR